MIQPSWCQWCGFFFSCSLDCPSRHQLNLSIPWQLSSQHNLSSTSTTSMFPGQPCQWCGLFPCSWYCPSRHQVNPLWQQQHDQYYYYPSPSREPSWGPTRTHSHAASLNHQQGFAQAEAQPNNQFIHASSVTISGDGSTGVVPGIALNDTNYNTGGGQVWRTPSRTH